MRGNNLINEIRSRLGYSGELPDDLSDFKYLGFDMHKTTTEDKDIENHNNEIIDLFKEYLPVELIKEHFDCWKGSCFLVKEEKYNPYEWKSLDKIIIDFAGWTTEEIIHWLITEKESYLFEITPKYFMGDEEQDEERVITKEMRYEICRRQKWRCNSCGERLKYSKNSDWEGKVAHIDHIHPFSKRKSYQNGREKINELSNLQALCPDCNFKKKDKEIE